MKRNGDPENLAELGRTLRGTMIDPELERHYEWIRDHRGRIDPERLQVYGIDVQSLASAGWGVIFGRKVTQEVRDALRPLLRRRQDAAGPLYREFLHQGEGKFQFLAEKGATRGVANPRSIPYYLLIVGDPSDVSFDFQSEMDMEYGVGRIFFDEVQQYKNYVKGVLAAETGISRPKEGITLFGVAQDEATRRTLGELVIPVANALEAQRKWNVRRIEGKEADRESLDRLLRGESASALLLTASHGMRFLPGDSLQVADQGALFCGPGDLDTPAGPVSRELYFSGDDVESAADLRGTVACLFACYSVGTPEFDSYREASLSPPPRIAKRPFVARLAQRLLGHPNEGGALAVLGHVDRMWSTSFSWTERGQVDIYESVLRSLLDGYPAGAATEYLGQLHASHGADFGQMSQDQANLKEGFDADAFARSWCAFNDARNFVLLGDPAVRLSYGGPG